MRLARCCPWTSGGAAPQPGSAHAHRPAASCQPRDELCVLHRPGSEIGDPTFLTLVRAEPGTLVATEPAGRGWMRPAGFPERAGPGGRGQPGPAGAPSARTWRQRTVAQRLVHCPPTARPAPGAQIATAQRGRRGFLSRSTGGRDLRRHDPRRRPPRARWGEVTGAPASVGACQAVRPKRRATSSTVRRECVDGGPPSSVMPSRAPSDAR
jgi:hypothetical protein